MGFFSEETFLSIFETDIERLSGEDHILRDDGTILPIDGAVAASTITEIDQNYKVNTYLLPWAKWFFISMGIFIALWLILMGPEFILTMISNNGISSIGMLTPFVFLLIIRIHIAFEHRRILKIVRTEPRLDQ